MEPLNTASNLGFLLLVLYGVFREQGRRFELAVLTIGWFGGTLYHARRDSDLWYWMDFVPIYLLAAAAAIKLWRKIASREASLFLTALFLSPGVLGAWTGNNDARLVASIYLGLFLSISIPMAYDLAKKGFRGISLPLLSVACFLVALAFRQLDLAAGAWTPHGTHFLWHTFGAVSVGLFMESTREESDAFRSDRIHN